MARRIIDRADIKVGDKIAVTETLTVTAVDDNWHTDQTVISYAELPGRSFSLMDGAEIELLDRPIPLPTAIGSVVTVNPRSSDPGTWLLTTAGWVSATHNVYSSTDFRAFLNKYHFPFEVIN